MYSINKKFVGWEEKKFTWRAAKLLPLHAALANPMQAALNDVVLAGKLSKPLFCLNIRWGKVPASETWFFFVSLKEGRELQTWVFLSYCFYIGIKMISVSVLEDGCKSGVLLFPILFFFFFSFLNQSSEAPFGAHQFLVFRAGCM